jgi:hypothetical protein
MHVWTLILAIVTILFAASWGVAIPAAVSLWTKLKKVYADYKAAVADGTITDAERIQLANDVMDAIADATTIFQFVANLIAAIVKVITASKAKKAP